MEVSLNAFDELCTRVSSDIDNRNLRTRSRTESEHTRFEYAVKQTSFLFDLLFLIFKIFLSINIYSNSIVPGGLEVIS